MRVRKSGFQRSTKLTMLLTPARRMAALRLRLWLAMVAMAAMAVPEVRAQPGSHSHFMLVLAVLLR